MYQDKFSVFYGTKSPPLISIFPFTFWRWKMSVRNTEYFFPVGGFVPNEIGIISKKKFCPGRFCPNIFCREGREIWNLPSSRFVLQHIGTFSWKTSIVDLEHERTKWSKVSSSWNYCLWHFFVTDCASCFCNANRIRLLFNASSDYYCPR